MPRSSAERVQCRAGPEAVTEFGQTEFAKIFEAASQGGVEARRAPSGGGLKVEGIKRGKKVRAKQRGSSVGSKGSVGVRRVGASKGPKYSCLLCCPTDTQHTSRLTFEVSLDSLDLLCKLPIVGFTASRTTSFVANVVSYLISL